MILLVLAAIGATVLIFSCIFLIVGIVTRRNPLSYILDKKPRKIDWVFGTLGFLTALIGISFVLYWKVKIPEVSQSGVYQFIFACVLVQLLMSVTYFCLLIYANYKNR